MGISQQMIEPDMPSDSLWPPHLSNEYVRQLTHIKTNRPACLLQLRVTFSFTLLLPPGETQVLSISKLPSAALTNTFKVSFKQPAFRKSVHLSPVNKWHNAILRRSCPRGSKTGTDLTHRQSKSTTGRLVDIPLVHLIANPEGKKIVFLRYF